MFRNGKLMAEEDGKTGGKGSATGNGTGNEPVGEDYKVKYEALKAESDKLLGRLDKLETNEKERETVKKEAADKERIKKEGAEAIIKEKDQALTSANERLAALEKREKERASKIFESLPKARQEALSELGLEKKLDAADWVTFLEKESAAMVSDEDELPPHVGGGRVARMGAGDNYEPTAKARDILKELGKSDEMLRQLEHVKDPDTGASKFRMPVAKFFSKMGKAPVTKLSTENARQRTGK